MSAQFYKIQTFSEITLFIGGTNKSEYVKD